MSLVYAKWRVNIKMPRSFGRSFARGMARAVISERNRRRRQADKVARQIQKIQFRASLKAEKERRRAAIKEEKEKYVSNRISEGQLKTENLLAFYDRYNRLVEKIFTSETVSVFCLLKKEYIPSTFVFDELYPTKCDPNLEPIPKASLFRSKKEIRLAVIQSNERKEKEAEEEFQNVVLEYNKRKEAAKEIWAEKEAVKKELIEKKNLEIYELECAYNNGGLEAITKYTELLFENIDYSEGTIEKPQFVYIPYKNKLIVNVLLKKTKEELFDEGGYRYLKQRDDYEPTKMKVGVRNERLKKLLVQLNIATFVMLLKNDIGNFFSEIVVNAYHDCICCVSGYIQKEEFNKYNLTDERDIQNFTEQYLRVYKQLTNGVKPFETMYANLQ